MVSYHQKQSLYNNCTSLHLEYTYTGKECANWESMVIITHTICANDSKKIFLFKSEQYNSCGCAFQLFLTPSRYRQYFVYLFDIFAAIVCAINYGEHISQEESRGKGLI